MKFPRLLPALFLNASILSSVLTGSAFSAETETVTVNPAKSEIVIAAGASGEAPASAAAELQKHLKLITGAEISIVAEDQVTKGYYPFYVGIIAPGDETPLKPEEARRRITKDGTYLYGSDERGSPGLDFAVYGFLEEELGVRWTEPGDLGIAVIEQTPLKLKIGAAQWHPEMLLRKIRTSWRPNKNPDQPIQVPAYVKEFADFIRSPEAHEKLAEDVFIWQKRMRMGAHGTPNYGHAFTTWWKQYGETHPDYFALKADGKRTPEERFSSKSIYTEDNPRGFQNIKLCVSNPAVVEQIIENWMAQGGPARTEWVNVCENDVPPVNYCECAACQALDVPKPGEEPMKHLTDRYVYLTNAVARRAREIDPAAGAVMYAYDRTIDPPRKLKLEPNVAVAMVPTTTELDQLEAYYKGWSEAGAKTLLLRPNYHTYFATTVIPPGYEKHMYDVFQTAYKYGARAADYDSLIGFWPITGLSDYVLARTFSDPDKPFEYWTHRYFEAYGPAAPEVEKYFAYWREEVWDKRLHPNLNKIVTEGKYFNFVRGLTWSLGDYYNEEDFDKTDVFLAEAAAQKLTPAQRARLDQLILGNTHARLTFNAITDKGQAQLVAAKKLHAFREAHKNDLNINWIGVCASESHFGDPAKQKIAVNLGEFAMPWLQTGIAWRFKLDPEDVGAKEGWSEMNWEDTEDWEKLRVDSNWENPYRSETDPDLVARLKDYNGVGWYSIQLVLPSELEGNPVLLYLGSVGGSLQVYINGRLAGSYEDKDPANPSSPVTIDIGPEIDWAQRFQMITLRVDDRGAAKGGINGGVWIVGAPEENMAAADRAQTERPGS